jgi:peptidoglycan/LPS O-acetylase OafA/YrhL
MLPNQGSADSGIMRYRRDIDGLRAISVLAVVAFHIQHSLLPGGFLGVDVFFVISGYLITGIIWREAQERRFSIAKFYERRIRRIMPALLVALACTTLASLIFLLPLDLVGQAKSVFATLAFVANVYFWRDTANYFGGAAEEKPLLHMWSLGVEEQFYIFFPLLLALLVRYARRSAPWIVLALAAGSFLLNVAAVKFGGAYPAFYMLPTRAWELGAGAFVSLLPRSETPRPMAGFVAGWIGLALVVFGITAKSEAMSAIPSTAAVVCGAAMILWAGADGRAGKGAGVSRLLGLAPFVFFGLISYSLYLWHWPIIVLSKYFLVRNLTLGEGIAALTLMIASATLSWRFIERPFRSKTITVRTVLLWTGGGAIAVALLAAAMILGHGFPRRLNADAARINAAVGTNYRCPVSQTMRLGLSRACPIALPSGKPADADVLLVGNSHAQMYAPLVGDILKGHGLNGLLVLANMCLPSSAVNVSTECARIADNYLNEVAKLSRPKLVVIAFNWEPEDVAFVDAAGKPLALTRPQAMTIALDATIDRLHKAGKQVLLVGPIAVPGKPVASIISRELAFGRPLTVDQSIPQNTFLREWAPTIAHFALRPDIDFVRADAVECQGGQCAYFRDGHALFADADHLTIDALARYRPTFDAAILHAYAKAQAAPRKRHRLRIISAARGPSR